MPARHARLRAASASLALAAVSCGGDDVRLGDGNTTADPLLDPPFSTPAVVTALSSEDTVDDDPSLTADRLVIYFNSERGGDGEEDIWWSIRAEPRGAFEAARSADALNTEHRETGIALSRDGLTIWFSSDRPGGTGGLDVYFAGRATRDDDWSEPARVEALSSPMDDLVSAVSADGLTLMLSRRSDDGDDYDLYTSTRADVVSEWGAPTRLDELSTDGEETDAFVVFDGLALVFTKDEDLAMADRRSENDPFGDPSLLDELNSTDDDRDAWIADAVDYIVFSSNRSGSYLLYEAFR